MRISDWSSDVCSSDLTRMVFRGIPAEQDRADLVAFLALAMAPGGAGVVVERDLVPAGWARGQRPEPLTPTPPGAQVTRVRHCGDRYFVTPVDERPGIGRAVCRERVFPYV